MTETLLAWGIEPVACTRFCEQPDLAHVGGTKDPDVGAIAALRPDLVILDVEENRREDHDALVAAGVPVRVLHIRSLADVDEQIGALAADLDAPWAPVGPLPPVEERLSAFVPIWRRPWMGLGGPTYGTSLLQAIGVRNVLAAAGPYPTVEPEEVLAHAPDIVIAPSEPYPFGERHRRELAAIAPPLFVDGRDLLWWGARTTGAIRRLSAQTAATMGG
jgi:ABC-type hemin transport system substrate-binding protein